MSGVQELKKECRYCLSDDKSGLLISPCKCEGTMKYVHNECLEDWIKNSKRNLKTEVSDKTKFFITKCEICKYEIKYVEMYQNGKMKSFYKFIKTVVKPNNLFYLLLHAVIVYLFWKRFQLLIQDFFNIYRKNFNVSTLLTSFHNITIAISIFLGIKDIYSFYHKIFLEKRKSFLKFSKIQ